MMSILVDAALTGWALGPHEAMMPEHTIDIDNDSLETCTSPGVGYVRAILFNGWKCLHCNASGVTYKGMRQQQAGFHHVPDDCPHCNGTGRLMMS